MYGTDAGVTVLEGDLRNFESEGRQFRIKILPVEARGNNVEDRIEVLEWTWPHGGAKNDAFCRRQRVY